MGALIPSSFGRAGRSTFRGGRGFAVSDLQAPICGLSGLSSCSGGSCGCSCGGRSSFGAADLSPSVPFTGPEEKVNCWATASGRGEGCCAGAALKRRPPKLGAFESSGCAAAPPPPKGLEAPNDPGVPKDAATGGATSLVGGGVEETSSSEDSTKDSSSRSSERSHEDPSSGREGHEDPSSGREGHEDPSSGRERQEVSPSLSSAASLDSFLPNSLGGSSSSFPGDSLPPAGPRRRTFSIPGEGGGTLGSAGSMKPGG